jgi:putative membrane protein
MNIVGEAIPLLTFAAGNDWGHPWWPVWLFFWAVLIGTAIWLIATRRVRRSEPLDRARELLAERYARGELSGDEYRERLEELKRSFQGGPQSSG